MKSLAYVCAALTLAALPLTVHSQAAANFPSKPVRFLVTYAPGGPTDILTRVLGSQMERKYHQPMIVENRPGAGQLVAADLTSKAPPDGHTLLAAINFVSYESLLNKDAPINTMKDIVPFAVYAGAGLFMTVSSKVPAKTLPEFISYVKANPGKVS